MWLVAFHVALLFAIADGRLEHMYQLQPSDRV